MATDRLRHTKIIATLGPAAETEETLTEMIRAGMNVARMNFFHGSHEEHAGRMRAVRAVRDRLGVPVALMLDTKGPDIRVGTFAEHAVTLEEGAGFTLTAEPVSGDATRVSVSYADLPEQVAPGQTILLDDGLIRLRVVSVHPPDIVCTVEAGGIVSDRKSLHVPGLSLDLPYISEQDREDLRFAAREGVEYVAASYVRDADDVTAVREILEAEGGGGIRIIAKIECADGVRNADRILDTADGIMVARGDMGVELDYVEIPSIQKDLIRKAQAKARISVIATQMLESMVRLPRPTRAEISDVANAIYDGASAVMLSGETAVGRHPVEAVRAMAHIADRTERDIHYRHRFFRLTQPENRDVTDAISYATVSMAHHLGAAAVVTPTQTGTTAMRVSRYRPDCPIVACTPVTRVYHQLALSWDVTAVLMEPAATGDVLQYLSVQAAKKSGLVRDGDLVVTTAGIPLGVSGTTNTIRVDTV